jgi:hypothetical protein
MKRATQDKDFSMEYLFNEYLQLPMGELEWEFRRTDLFPPEDVFFLINPRRLRGSDFLMRWSQGRWSEDVVLRAINGTSCFGVVPYGPSTVAPDDPNDLEAFLEKMDVISGEGKRPDMLLYDSPTFKWAQSELQRRLGSAAKMAETPSDQLRDIVVRAKAALEIENSLWVTDRMPGYGKPFGRFLRGKKKGRIKASGVVPTIIVKEEDISRLQQWEATFGVPIYIVHLFYDRGYFIKFKQVVNLIQAGDVGAESQRFSNPDGTAATPKRIIKVPYVLCQEFGSVSGQRLEPRTFVDKNGKVMTYVVFSGGEIRLAPAAFREWAQ